MTEQMGTPGSTADTSVNGSKIGASKDKQCPFCQQSFTSSSLGRHLDLYIKEKNPKPADGIHNVDEIRKLRGGITRRQPRNSMSKREDSTPADTPGAQDRRSPPSEGRGSPTLRREPMELAGYSGLVKAYVNKGTFESTGVMNNIPTARNGGQGRSWEGEDRDTARRLENRSRSVSKQMLAKSTFEQKQKMVDALDTAKAAELALRELFGSLRAAKQRIEGPSIFDYDPLTLDFPSLTLHCLPPPPTLHQSTPLPSSSSWSILPPNDQQYEALRAHFSSKFQQWRVACAIATTVPQDDLSYPPRELYNEQEDPSEVAQRVEAEASELESKISEHIHSMYAHWNSLPAQKRADIWTLNLARSVGRKFEELEKLREEKVLAQQEAQHLRLQIDELSRLQYPREFKLSPPRTTPIDSKLMGVAAEMGMNSPAIGFTFSDRSQHVDVVVEQVIGRWKDVVKRARGGGSGLAGQRSLSGESASTQPPASAQLKPNPTPRQQQNQNMNHTANMTMTNGVDMGSDQDADADADMEEDDSFVEMIDTSHSNTQQAPAASFRLTNGNSNRSSGHTGMEGLENQTVVQGYVRIGAH